MALAHTNETHFWAFSFSFKIHSSSQASLSLSLLHPHSLCQPCLTQILVQINWAPAASARSGLPGLVQRRKYVKSVNPETTQGEMMEHVKSNQHLFFSPCLTHWPSFESRGRPKQVTGWWLIKARHNENERPALEQGSLPLFIHLKQN